MKTQTVRQRKVADKIKQLVSVMIDRRLNDPQIGFTTLTHVRMSPDLRIAYIYFTVLGDEKAVEATHHGLQRAAGFIRSELGPELKMRFVPELRFFPDDTMAYSNKINRLLDDLKKPDDDAE